MIRFGYLGDIEDKDFDISEDDYGFYCQNIYITGTKDTDQ